MNWLKQTEDKPLFPAVLWSRPENRRHAGKLLIIGGHMQSFNAVSVAYGAAMKAGIGTVRVFVPDALHKMLVKLFPEAEFAASTPIGSFSRQALGELLEASQWADGVLLAGDFGRNSETAVLLDGFIDKYQGLLAMGGDSVDYFLKHPAKLTSRPRTLVIAQPGQLQKLAAPYLIRQSADLVPFLQQLSKWVSQANLSVITVHSNHAITGYKEQVSTTPVNITETEPKLAAYATVWLLQQPTKPFEALTSAVYRL